MSHRHYNVGKDNPAFGRTGSKNPMYGRRRFGENNPYWKGGKVKSHGYVYVMCREHPYADRHGYVPEHRLLMEKKLGRYLWNFEVIHHINGIVNDNRIENLELFTTNGEHMSHHAQTRRIPHA